MSQDNQTNHDIQSASFPKSGMTQEAERQSTYINQLRQVSELPKQSINPSSSFISNMEEIVGERLLDDW